MSGSSGLGNPVFREPIGEDEKLRAELRWAGALDPVPDDLNAAAKSSFAWYTLDAELAELTFDSAADERSLAGMRGGSAASGAPRMLTFEAPGITVEVEAVADGSRRRLIGQLVPPQAGRVEVRHRDGTAGADTDEVGRFTLDDLAPGAVSLHCQGTDGTIDVTTDWVLI